MKRINEITGGMRFTSEGFPDAVRIGAWQEAVTRLALTSTLSDVEVGLTGRIGCQTSSLGGVD
jgi:hypothetical protein